MKHFLSAFSDADCVTILHHCKQCLAPSGAILLLQTLVPEPGDRAHNNTEDGVAPGVMGGHRIRGCATLAQCSQVSTDLRQSLLFEAEESCACLDTSQVVEWEW